MATVDFYFDFRSPYTYLALTRLDTLPCDIRWRPFDVLAAMEQVGNVPTTRVCAAKGHYARRDIQRWTGRYGVRFAPNPSIAAMDAHRMLRAALAAESEDICESVTRALFVEAWTGTAPLATAGDLIEVLEATGLDSARLGDLDRLELVDRLERATTEAARRGVFGTPTFFVGDEMFFGNDRLDFVHDALKEAI